VVIATNGMGVIMLSILVEGKTNIVDIPQMERPDEMGIDSVVPMALMHGREDNTRVPPIIFLDGLEVSTIQKKHFSPT